eukprot:Stramenopile-MAST_4_protein_5740
MDLELNKLNTNFKHTFEIGALLKHIIDAQLEISKGVSVDRTISATIKQTCCVIKCERASLWIVDKRRRILWTRVEGVAKARTVEMSWNQGIAGFVRKQNEFAHVVNANSDHRFDHTCDAKTGFKTRNLLVAPLHDESGEVVAVVEARNKHDSKAFTMIDEITLKLLGRQAGVSIAHILMYDEVSHRQATLQRFICSSHLLAPNVIDNDVLDFMLVAEQECKHAIDGTDSALFLKDFSGEYLWCSSRVRDSKVMVWGQSSHKEVRRMKYRLHERVGIAGHVTMRGNEVIIKAGEMTMHPHFNDNMDIDNADSLVCFPLKLGGDDDDIVGCFQVTLKDPSLQRLELLRMYCIHIASFAHLVAQVEAEKESDVSQRDSTVENLFKAWRAERQTVNDDKERKKIIAQNHSENEFTYAIDAM